MKTRIIALLLALCALTTLLVPAPARAGSATWSGQLNSNWNVAGNWSPQTVPNGASDVATMASASNRTVSLSANVEVNGITFPKPVSPFIAVNYGITVGPGLTLTISGTGITNNSGQAQNFLTTANGSGQRGEIFFSNSATAGSGTFTNSGSMVTGIFAGFVEFAGTSSAGNGAFTNNGAALEGASGGFTEFTDSATAGNGTFTNRSGTVSGAGGGETDFSGTSSAGFGTFTNNGSAAFSGALGSFEGDIFFNNNSTAANGTFINNGGTVSGASGGETVFLDTSSAGFGTFTSNGGTAANASGGIVQFSSTSTAGSGTFTNNGGTVSGAGGSATAFFDESSAGSATLIGNGGTSGGIGSTIFFENDSSGAFARVEVFGNGLLEIGGHNAPGVGVGSIQGNGFVGLGSNNLTVGLNNLSTVFSGLIEDFGAGGSLTKIGRGKLTLSKANTYTGGTTLNGGTLLVKNKTGSGTGSGAIQVNNGTLEGTGKINGAVMVGNGSLSGAILLAGNSAKSPGTFTINNTLTFNSLSTYKCVLNRSTPKASTITALGVTINSNVPFTFIDTGTGALPVGTVFTIVNNISANPIAGTFSNLANGSTFTSNGNTFKVSYTGGTGNDLTLKVVQ
jgi:autotransporter-associated beta strand protein